MLPKERMIAALEHREADRIPVGELASDFEMTERVLGRRTYYRSKWREYVAEWEGRRDEIAYSYGHDVSDLARKLEWDFVVVNTVPGRKPAKRPEMLGEYVWRDETGKVWQYEPETGGHAMLIEAPMMTLEQLVVPDKVVVDEAQIEAIAQTVKDVGGSHFVVGRLPETTFAWRQTVGMDEYLVKMITDPEFVLRAEQIYLKRALALIEAMCDAGVDAVIETTDYCGNDGPMMGPALFRKFILPSLVQMAAACHARGKYFLKHTDGKTWSILDDMVEAGVDGWQGIQPSIGMDLRLLEEKYAGKLCLFGGVNNETLIAGTPEEVEAEVKYAIKHAAPGGGYVLASGNTLQPGTNFENYVAMLAAGREYGGYPIRLQ